MSRILPRLKRTWCETMHSEISWPVGGLYHCLRCREVFRVSWSEPLLPQLNQNPRPSSIAMRESRVPHKVAA
jgi:hypothetical protein